MPCFFCGNLEAPGILKPHQPCQLLDGEPCSPCKEIQELEPQIAKAKDALHKILIRYYELRKQMNRSHNPTIHNLPPEILSHIFELSIPERPLDVSSRGLSQNEIRAPLTLGSICQVWRQIAFSTPQLWTTIFLYLGNNLQFEKTAPTHYELATQWLSRSGELPLSIYIFGNGKSSEPAARTFVTKFMELVNQHSSRWKHLELDLPYFLASHLRGNASKTSILDSLRLHHEDDSDEDDFDGSDEGTLALSKLSPKIVSLHDWPFNRVDIEWGHATNVNLESLDISDCIEVVRCAADLKCFKSTDTSDRSADGIVNISSYAIPTTPFIRPLLQELYISVRIGSDAAKFANSFTLPGLQILAISVEWGGSFPVDIFISLINRSSCHLTTLSIHSPTLDSTEILPLLQATPSVRNLIFSGLSDIGFFKALKLSTLTSGGETGRDGHVLPALESLILRGEHHQSFPWISLSETLTETFGLHRQPLRKFEIHLIKYGKPQDSLYMDEDSTHHLLKLGREAGIALHFRISHHQYSASGEYRFDELDLLQLSLEHHSKTNKFS